MKKTILSIVTLFAFGVSTHAQNVNIPDANFKAYLVGNASINTNSDTEIQTSEASAFTGLIDCGGHNISDLTGIEAFINLTSLYCDNNNLTSLDVSSNTSLTSLECYQNNITSLDVSQHPSIIGVYAFNNDLTSVNVAYGNNAGNHNISLVNNPNLTCIQVDAGFTPPPNGAAGWYKDATASYSDNCAPCTINIPDANFKAYLVGNAAINTNGDTEIQCGEASAFTGNVNCQNLGVSDLTGIEAFTNIQYLYCGTNSITSLNLSQNTSLLEVRCQVNSLTSLIVGQNTSLTTLFCQSNSLTSLDVTQNTQLIELKCEANSISNLDLSQNTGLSFLTCQFNNVSSLDLSNNSMLTFFQCYDNQLSSLNVANGNNSIFTMFSALNNPNLTCIQVDDATYSTTNWTYIDAQTSFSENCSSAVLVSSITVQGQGGVSTITTQGGTLQMEATVLPANADDATYTWSVMNGSGTATIDANGILTAITDGTVTVIANANDASGIAGTATITISNQSVGLNKIEMNNVSFYPNPVNNELFIDVAEEQINHLEIIDYTGRIVKTVSNKQVKSIDVSNLTQGIYILKVSTEKGISAQQFIKK